MNQLIFAFPLLTSEYSFFGRFLFRARGAQEASVFSTQTLTKEYIVTNMEIKFTFPTHEQNQYVVECVERSSFDPKQN